nr:heme-binding protein [Shimwellia pseudoproteus]
MPGVAAAVTPSQQHDMNIALATALATETLSQCQQLGKNGVVAVVDRGGNPVVVMRGDNVGPHNTLAAQRKAYTSLSTKTPTLQLAKNARANSDANNLNTVQDLLLLGGGVPVSYQQQVIGALGVAGMGGPEFDEKCAVQAIAKVLPTA